MNFSENLKMLLKLLPKEFFIVKKTENGGEIIFDKEGKKYSTVEIEDGKITRIETPEEGGTWIFEKKGNKTYFRIRVPEGRIKIKVDPTNNDYEEWNYEGGQQTVINHFKEQSNLGYYAQKTEEKVGGKRVYVNNCLLQDDSILIRKTEIPRGVNNILSYNRMYDRKTGELLQVYYSDKIDKGIKDYFQTKNGWIVEEKDGDDIIKRVANEDEVKRIEKLKKFFIENKNELVRDISIEEMETISNSFNKAVEVANKLPFRIIYLPERVREQIPSQVARRKCATELLSKEKREDRVE